MARDRSKKKEGHQQLSPVKYIKTKARNLPIDGCWIDERFSQDTGVYQIIISRKHKSGNHTFGVYLVDAFCLGVKDTFFHYNEPEDALLEVVEKLNLLQVPYEEVHNLIYGAVAYAEDLGIDPHVDFGVTQYILEEDDDAIPLIEYEFGRNGKPTLVARSHFEANRYIPILKEYVGDDFEVLIKVEEDDEDGREHFEPYNYDDDFDYDDDDDFDDDDEFDENEEFYNDLFDSMFGDYYDDENDDFEDDFEDDEEGDDDAYEGDEFALNGAVFQSEELPGIYKKEGKKGVYRFLLRKKMEQEVARLNTFPYSIYTYNHPDYPTSLTESAEEVNRLLMQSLLKFLDDDIIELILARPKQSVVDDLNRIILYHIGQTCDLAPEDEVDENDVIIHATMLLGELQSTQSLDVILETLRQRRENIGRYYGRFIVQIMPVILYRTGQNQLPKLVDFIKEPGLTAEAKVHAFDVLAMVAFHEPQRRSEAIEYMRDVLNFFYDNIDNNQIFDSPTVGFLIREAVYLRGTELLPEIEKLYATGLIYGMYYPDIRSVKKDIKKPLDPADSRLPQLKTIYELYENMI